MTFWCHTKEVSACFFHKNYVILLEHPDKSQGCIRLHL